MAFALLTESGRFARQRKPHGPLVGPRRFRPALENLESRWTPAVLGLPIDVTEVRVVDGQLEAVVELAGQAAEVVPLTATTEAPLVGEECPLLNLELGPINLNLLGLHVDTSEICLDVTASDHTGLLGSLLCDLSGGGLDLGGILGELSGIVGGVNQFLDSLEALLDNILGQAMTVTSVLGSPLDAAAVDVLQAEDHCDILNLALGPIDLAVPLLGVNVHLDDCNDGPVTVDVTADPEGGLLGSLLCGLAGGIDLGGIDTDALIGQIDQLIDRLGALADRLENLPDLPRNLEAQLDNLQRTADRVDSLRDLDRLLDRVDRLIDRLDREIGLPLVA
jgi:hypothetical protein